MVARARPTAEGRNRIRFPADIAAMRGPRAAGQAPQVVVGTIHSVKGGEADVVYLFPDLSRSGDAGLYRGGADHDVGHPALLCGIPAPGALLGRCCTSQPARERENHPHLEHGTS